MKLIEFIEKLQDLEAKIGNVEVEINITDENGGMESIPYEISENCFSHWMAYAGEAGRFTL